MRHFFALPILALAACNGALDSPPDSSSIVLKGNTHPLARPEYETGATSPSLRMERMVLSLKLTDAKKAELEQLLAQQQDLTSPNYHRWLTPEQFGARFGRTAEEVATTTRWLQSQGFTIDEIGKGGTWINYSGTAAAVGSAFRTQMREYRVGGVARHANAIDPSIPSELAGLVAGVVSLHSFPRHAMNLGVRQPDYTSTNGGYYLSPGDFAIIYNVNPLYSAGIDGSGQSIAIVGRTHPQAYDVAWFRANMGLPANPPQVIVNGTDPGDLGNFEDAEANLDVEWSGAVAKGATIKFVASKSTASTDGVDLSAQYIVDNNLAPIMSTSFGSCEFQMGNAENTFFNNLWAQAAAQGITSFVAEGDTGAAACDTGAMSSGTGRAINGLSSTPYNVSAGGTQFVDTPAETYWRPTSLPWYISALGYIPEVGWNQSGNVPGGEGLWASGGGASLLYVKPSWQVAPGVPADGRRDTPDLSLSAASHDGYLVYTEKKLIAMGGNSAVSPSLAGLMALIVQKTGARQGNANPRFYQLGAAQYGSGGPAVYHDILVGDNSVPGVTGFSCGPGYDQVTGLGTVDAYALVNNWADFGLSASPAAVSVVQGTSSTSTLTTAVMGGFSDAVSLSASGLPIGATATFSPASIAGAGTSTLTLSATGSTAPGTYPVTIVGTGGTMTRTATVALTVIQGGATTVLFADGFEGTGWSMTQVSGSGGSWTLVAAGNFPSASPHGGTKMADFNSYTAAAGNQTLLLRAAGIAIPSTYQSATLTFWMYHDTGFNIYPDKLQVQVSTNGTTWTNVGSPAERLSGSTGWAQITVDLSAYIGTTVQLGFLGMSAWGNDIYLDDVAVVGWSNVATYSVSGTVTLSGAGLSGVTLAADTNSATSSSTGAYTLSRLVSGTYKVIPTLSGYTFSPASQVVTVSSANATGVDFAATKNSPPTTLFSDGFENSDWSAAQVSGTAGVWSLVASGSFPVVTPHGGSKLAAFNSYTSRAGNQTRLYRATGFAIGSNYTAATLTFWMYHETGYATYDDRLQVQVSTDGSTWTNVSAEISRYNGTTGWAPVTIDLSVYKGQSNLRLGFVGISLYGNDIYLDDVSVVAH